MEKTLYWLNGFVAVCALSFAALLLLIITKGGEMLTGDTESLLFPVVENWRFEDWKREANGVWSVRVIGTKVRPCRFLPEQNLSGLFTNNDDSYAEQIAVTMIDSPVPNSTRPLGLQSFGRWRLESDRIAPGAKVWGSRLYNCHAGRATIVHWGPVVVGGKSGP